METRDKLMQEVKDLLAVAMSELYRKEVLHPPATRSPEDLQADLEALIDARGYLQSVVRTLQDLGKEEHP